MIFFGLGNLFYVSILLVNAIAILSEDRFLARIGWGNAQSDPGFGASSDTASVKAKIVNLIASVRTLMRSMLQPQCQSEVHKEVCIVEKADSKDSTANSDKYSGDRLRASTRVKGEKET
ncbi:MAG: hypothetical protein M1830_006253 [Pleopsidium flavum]|nr:MAG: hypothetical protein M1830_006253 [Pleopsidium flavum]